MSGADVDEVLRRRPGVSTRVQRVVRVSFRRPDPEPRRELGGDRLHLGERPSEGSARAVWLPASRNSPAAVTSARRNAAARADQPSAVGWMASSTACSNSPSRTKKPSPSPRAGDPGQGVQFVPSFDLAARIPEDDHPATSDPLAGKPHT